MKRQVVSPGFPLSVVFALGSLAKFAPAEPVTFPESSNPDRRSGRGTPRRPRHAFVPIAGLLALLIGPAPWGSSPAHAQDAPARSESGFFYDEGEPFPAMVALDRIGVLLKEGVRPQALTEAAANYRLRPLQEIEGTLVILGVAEPTDRLKLAELARTFKRENAELVAQAGLLVTPPQAGTPMVMGDEFVVQFREGVNRTRIDALNRSFATEVVMENPFAKNQFLLRVTDRTGMTALEASNLYQESELVEFAHPNFVKQHVPRQAIPNDTLFNNQWHHQNTGQAGGTVDADIDSPEAWAITTGLANVVIAVIDGGFDLVHPDIAPNYWTNPGEVAGNGLDDDGNTFFDDVNGWDFTGCDAAPGAGCGDANATGPDTAFGRHGTSVAGSAAAAGNNALGVTGTCQNCTVMPLRIGGFAGSFSDALAFGYAQQMGAAIITNSWGYAIGTPATTAVVNAINAAATNGRGGLGSVVFFAMNNPNLNDCGATPDISSPANVIAVSRSTNRDQFDFSGFGNCMDLLAPSAGLATVGSGRGTLWGTTTDMQGNAGYNNNAVSASCPTVEASPPPANARDYTACFNGTSFATPITAGAAGLILSVNAGLTRLQVQRLLQDTADKIEDSTGSYAANTGFSTPAGGNATHGWGRVNAFEAVRVAAPVAQGGRGAVDLFLRDNRLDWGNTEQPSNTLFEPARGYIGHWRSADLKVDAPPYQPVPTAATFDAFIDETPSAVPGDVNRVYVRVRNRGPLTAASVTVKLHWTQFGTALPALPPDFWTAFPADSTDTSQWRPLTCSGTTTTTCTINNLAYSGASVATTGADMAQIVQFDFPAPPVDPMLPNHFCLLTMVDSPQDRILPKSRPTIAADFVVDTLTPTDNNTTHRNYHDLNTARVARFEQPFFVRNPTDRLIRARLRLAAPEGWEADLDRLGFDRPFDLKAHEEVLVRLSLATPAPGAQGEVTVFQELEKPRQVMGGVTFRLSPVEKPAADLPKLRLIESYEDLLRRHSALLERFAGLIEKLIDRENARGRGDRAGQGP